MQTSFTKSPESVGIVGCGWLGKPLALLLQQQGYKVAVSTTSKTKQNALQSDGLNAHILCLPQAIEMLIKNPVLNVNQLIIAITPQFRHGKKDYPEKIQQLVDAAIQTGCQHIILLSSSAIYDQTDGVVNEQSPLPLTSEKAQLLNQAEQAVLQLNKLQLPITGTVLRLSGLVGPSRFPGNFFAGKTNIPAAHDATNLIHQHDANAIIRLLLSKKLSGVFNAVSPIHHSKQTFYTFACRLKNLPTPQFKETEQSTTENLTGKIINGDETVNQLAYHFKYPDLMAWLGEYASN